MQTDQPDPIIDLSFLRDCLWAAGELALRLRWQVETKIKADHSPVTEADQQVEEFLIQKIHARYPGHPILSEETGHHGSGSDYIWVIDPIDGTRSFAGGLPVWGVSIGVLREGQPLAGGFYLPTTGELYWGTHQEAFYNDRPLPLVHSVDLDNPLAFLGVASNFHLRFRITYPRIRSIGSTAAHLAYAATGAAAGVLTRSASLWDLAGLLPALQAVGIEGQYLSGRPFQASDLLDGRSLREGLLFAHPSIFEALRGQIHPISQ